MFRRVRNRPFGFFRADEVLGQVSAGCVFDWWVSTICARDRTEYRSFFFFYYYKRTWGKRPRNVYVQKITGNVFFFFALAFGRVFIKPPTARVNEKIVVLLRVRRSAAFFQPRKSNVSRANGTRRARRWIERRSDVNVTF